MNRNTVSLPGVMSSVTLGVGNWTVRDGEQPSENLELKTWKILQQHSSQCSHVSHLWRTRWKEKESLKSKTSKKWQSCVSNTQHTPETNGWCYTLTMPRSSIKYFHKNIYYIIFIVKRNAWFTYSTTVQNNIVVIVYSTECVCCVMK